MEVMLYKNSLEGSIKVNGYHRGRIQLDPITTFTIIMEVLSS